MQGEGTDKKVIFAKQSQKVVNTKWFTILALPIKAKFGGQAGTMIMRLAHLSHKALDNRCAPVLYPKL